VFARDKKAQTRITSGMAQLARYNISNLKII